MKMEVCCPEWRLDTYVDADWATNTEDRRSVSGCVITLGGAPIHTHSRTQQAVALSSCESEMYAMVSGASEMMFVKTLLEEQRIPVSSATLWSDSQSAIAMAYKKGPGTRLKHVALRALACQSWIQSKAFGVAKIHTSNNPADYLTKSVSQASFEMGRQHCCISPPMFPS